TAPPAASVGRSLARALADADFGVVASRDAQRDVPTFFWAPPGGPRPPQSWPATPEAWARFYLDHYAPVYGLSKEALATAAVVMTHDTGRGGIIVTLRQQINDIEVHRNDVKVLMRRDGELVAITGNLHPSASASMKRGNVFTIGPAQAVAGAFSDRYDIKLSSVAITDAKQTKGAYSYFNLGITPEIYAAKLHFVDP